MELPGLLWALGVSVASCSLTLLTRLSFLLRKQFEKNLSTVYLVFVASMGLRTVVVLATAILFKRWGGAIADSEGAAPVFMAVIGIILSGLPPIRDRYIKAVDPERSKTWLAALDNTVGLDTRLWVLASSSLNRQMIRATSLLRQRSAGVVDALFEKHTHEILEHVKRSRKLRFWFGPPYELGDDLQSEVPRGSPKRLELLLNTFDFPFIEERTESEDDRRGCVRIEIEPPFQATISDGGRHEQCEIKNLSQTGARVLVTGARNCSDLNWNKGRELTLRAFEADHNVTVAWEPRERSLGLMFTT